MKVENYKRLTNQEWSDHIDLSQEYGYSYIYKRLYELENKLEQGVLVELPCKVGDSIYWVTTIPDEISPHSLLRGTVQGVSIQTDGIWIYAHYDAGLTYWHSDLKDLFFTKDAALKRLEELKK